MKDKCLKMVTMALVLTMVSCTTHYMVEKVERTRLLVDKAYDVPISPEITDFMAPYKSRVDSVMSPVIGRAAKYLSPERPEGTLSNLLPDILVWAGKFYGEKPDFGIYNRGGIRASIAAGDITIGDIVDVAPFENKMCFITLSGEKALQLMEQIAYRGGEGVSREVRIVMDKNNHLKHATIGGKEIDPNGSYRVATIDYLSHGNDRLTALKDGTDRREMTGEEDLMRSVIMKYIKEQTAQGKAIDCDIEGRIIVEE